MAPAKPCPHRTQEIELKLLADEVAARAAWPNAVAAGLSSGEPPARLLTSTYFDTPGHRLRKAGIALRVRRDGDRILQTVKARASIHGGLSRAIEVESVLEDAKPDLAAIADAGLRGQISSLAAGKPLAPVFETIVRRTEAEVRHDTGTSALLAVDDATIVAGGTRASFRELEIELLSGPVEGLFAIARILLPSGRLRFSTMSKAERGFLLAETGMLEPAPEPRFAGPAVLPAKATCAQALELVLRECAAQISANVEVVLALNVPEGPHQLRVGLRRLRSAIGLFRKVLGSPAAGQLGSEARWLGQEAGRLRDLQVITTSLVPGYEAERGRTAGLDRLTEALDEMAEQSRTSLRDSLQSERAAAFLFDLVRFTESCGWLASAGDRQQERLGQRVDRFAAKSLDKRWRKVRKTARHIETLSVEERHALRKELKKLRYAAEFFEPLFRPSRVKPFLAALKRLQDVFGELNDTAVLEARLGELPADMLADAEVQHATGLLIGTFRTRADMHWHEARQLWADLKKLKAFWS